MAVLDGHKVKLFSLSANKKLAEEISEYSGIPLSKIDLSRFADGEIGINLDDDKLGFVKSRLYRRLLFYKITSFAKVTLLTSLYSPWSLCL